MNTPLFVCFWLMALLMFAPTAWAQKLGYICEINGKAVYTSMKKGKQCQRSYLSGGESLPVYDFAPAPKVSAHVALPETRHDIAPKRPKRTLLSQKRMLNIKKSPLASVHTPSQTPIHDDKPILTASAVVMLALSLSPVAEVEAQTTYICLIHGKPAYTTVKQDKTCQPSKMDGIGESEQWDFAPAPKVSEDVALNVETASAPAVSVNENDKIARIWTDYEYGSYDRTPILPPPPPRTEKADNNSIANTTAKATTRKPASQSSGSRPNFANIVYQPPTAPVLSRREVLSKEIEREQIALKIAQVQLSLAKKRNDVANMARLDTVVRDRQQNVLSLQRELQR